MSSKARAKRRRELATNETDQQPPPAVNNWIYRKKIIDIDLDEFTSIKNILKRKKNGCQNDEELQLVTKEKKKNEGIKGPFHKNIKLKNTYKHDDMSFIYAFITPSISLLNYHVVYIKSSVDLQSVNHLAYTYQIYKQIILYIPVEGLHFLLATF